MKRNIFKRFAIFVLSVVMILGSSLSAFAAEVPTSIQTEVIEEGTPIELSENSAVTLNTGAYGTCTAFGTLTLKPTLTSTGLLKTFWFWAAAVDSDVTPIGYVTVTVKKPNGEILNSFIAFPDEDYTYSFVFPSTGTYTVLITSYCQQNLFCNAVWEA